MDASDRAEGEGRPADDTVKIADGLDVVVLSEDELLVQYGTRSQPSELLRDTELTGMLGKMGRRLAQGPARQDELISLAPASCRADASAVIGQLLDRGILANARTDPVDQYLGYLFSGQSSLAQYRVGVIGAGPIGYRIALTLLQHGVGTVFMLDDRIVDAHWRAFTDLGTPPGNHDGLRADVAARQCLLASGHSRVEAIAAGLDDRGIAEIVGRSDLLVVAFERPSIAATHLVNRLCVGARKPWLLVTIDGNLATVGPLFTPPDTACYNDFRVLADAATPNPDMARRYLAHLVEQSASFFPGLPAYVDLLSGYGSLAAVHFLLRGTSFALARALVIDVDRMIIDVEDVLRLPRCPVCKRDSPAAEPPFPAELVTRVREQEPG